MDRDAFGEWRRCSIRTDDNDFLAFSTSGTEKCIGCFRVHRTRRTRWLIRQRLCFLWSRSAEYRSGRICFVISQKHVFIYTRLPVLRSVLGFERKEQQPPPPPSSRVLFFLLFCFERKLPKPCDVFVVPPFSGLESMQSSIDVYRAKQPDFLIARGCLNRSSSC